MIWGYLIIYEVKTCGYFFSAVWGSHQSDVLGAV